MKLAPLPAYGELLQLNEWFQLLQHAELSSFDGSGHWATASGMEHGSDVWADPWNPPAWATHTMWFSNKK